MIPRSPPPRPNPTHPPQSNSFAELLSSMPTGATGLFQGDVSASLSGTVPSEIGYYTNMLGIFLENNPLLEGSLPSQVS